MPNLRSCPATVVNVGTAQAASLDFGIPQGIQGATGATGSGYGGTSVTSLLIANSATKTFTTQAGLAYQVGNYVRASSAANGANFMEGLVSAYSGTTLSIAVTKIGGSGTLADWVFAVSGAPGTGDLLSTNNLSDVANAATARTNLAVPGLATSNAYTKQQTAMLQTLTDAASVAWDTSLGQKAKVVLGGNRTMAAVTNAVEGTTYFLWALQDATGTRTLAYTTSGAGSFDFGAAGVPVLTTTLNRADLLCFEAMTIGGTLKLRYAGIKFGFA